MFRPVVTAIMLTSLTFGCAHQAPYRPDTPHPSAARIQELLAQPVPRKGKSDPAPPPAIAVERVLPLVGAAPLTVRAFVRLEWDEANRDYCLTLVSEDGLTVDSSCRNVEGRVWTHDFTNVAAGRYLIVLTVSRNDGRGPLRSVSQPLCYAGMMLSCGLGEGS